MAGFTALHMAAMNNNVEVMHFLMRAGANTLYKGQSGLTPLHIAAEKGNDAAVKALLESDADIHSRGPRGWTPVQLACAHGHFAVLKRLVDAGSNLKVKGPRGLTAMHLAAAAGHEAVIRFLINQSIPVDEQDNAGRSPLSWAAADGHQAIVKLLLEFGANPGLQDETIFDGDAKKASGADRASARDSNPNFTPAHWAASNGHAGVLRELIKGDADVNVLAGERQLSALHVATVCGHDTSVELLVASGANIEQQDADGNTPIQLSRKGTIHKMLAQS
jgi:ankyrin repeat protein